MYDKMTEHLVEIMNRKSSNLAVSLDVTTQAEFFHILEIVAPHICMLKTHVDIISDFDESFIERIRSTQKKYDFLILEDRKFADIGHTMQLQLDGIYRIGEWADMVTAHAISGAESLDVFCGKIDVLLLAQLSSSGNLIDATYSKKAMAIARLHPAVIGVIGQSQQEDEEHVFMCTPGVRLGDESGDGLGQRYRTPKTAVENGASVIIVGRGIINAPDILVATLEYKEAGWQAYSR